MLRSIGAVAAGLIAVFGLGRALGAAVMALLGPMHHTVYLPLSEEPSLPPFTQHMIAFAVVALVVGLIAGWLTARIAPAWRMTHVAITAGAVTALSIVQMIRYGAPITAWDPLTLIGLAGVFIGGWLGSRARVDPVTAAPPHTM